MKYLRMLIITCLVIALAFCIAACDKGETPTQAPTMVPTEAPTEKPTEAPTEAPSETPTEAPDVTVEYSVTVIDQEGAAVPDAKLSLLVDDEVKYTATTDADGKATLSVKAGNYALVIDEMSEGYYDVEYSHEITASVDNVSITLEVVNNTPNGTEERPYVMLEDALVLNIPAGETYHLLAYGSNRILNVENPSVKITYKGKDYTPNSDGVIELEVSAETAREPIKFTVTNTSESENTVTVNIASPLGTAENPIIITDIGAEITAEDASADGIVYYKWISTGSGILAVTSYDAHNNISFYNMTTYVVSSYTDGSVAEYIQVNAGDEISITVSSKSSEASDVTFTLSLCDGDADSPVMIIDSISVFGIMAGKELSFTAETGSITVSGSDIEVIFGDSTLTPDEEGKIELDLSEGDVFTVKNTSEERREITVTITE